MKQLKKISLSQISKKEMEKRELNQLLGGIISTKRNVIFVQKEWKSQQRRVR